MKQLIRFLNSLSFSNGIVVFLAMLSIVFVLWHFIFWQPLQNDKNIIASQIITTKQDIQNLKLQLENTKKTKQLQNPIQSTLITTHKIYTILKSMIGIRQNLKLIELQILPQQTITNPVDNKSYILNNFSLKFSGTYFSTLSYLKSLEKEAIPFFWDSLTYKVTAYPYAEVSLKLHVLSY